MDKDNVFIYMLLLLVISSPDGFAGKFEFGVDFEKSYRDSTLRQAVGEIETSMCLIFW